ncbi:MAG: SPFH domain-containing protein [Clostridiales bacterium]|nr:SPFH domain-containing protein [Clostridiales bacterium]
MGLIKMVKGAVGSTFRDAVKDYFRCDGMSNDYLCIPAAKVMRDGTVNNASDRIITNGSVFDVTVNQAALLIENGKVHDFVIATDESVTGQYKYDSSVEPSVLGGGLKDFVPTFQTMAKRFTAGGQSTNTMYLVYINLKEITQNPVGFGRTAFMDKYLGTRLMLSGFGYYTFKIANPVAFYENLVMDPNRKYDKEEILAQLKQELQPQLMAAVGRISPLCENGYQDIYVHQKELADAANEALKEEWLNKRGILIESIAVTPQLSDEDKERVMQLENAKTLSNSQMAMGTLVGAQAEAMKSAAKNEGGAMNGFIGMGMAMNAGGFNTGALLQQQMANEAAMKQQQSSGMMGAVQADSSSAAQAGQWICSCGTKNGGKFCVNCGSPKPEEQTEWVCSCGAKNSGKFCMNCGAKKPERIKGYRCDKCGWETTDITNPPKFCPQCGDKIEEVDILR